MEYIVLDLEWNQPDTEKFKRVTELPFEIIEIGAVKLNDKFEIIADYEGIIRPVVYPRLHAKIREILTYDERILRTGRGFRKVAREFLEWCGKDYIFCTWGSYDLVQLQYNLEYYKFPKLRKPLKYYDIQFLYCLAQRQTGNLPSLESAIDTMAIFKPQQFHRAINDARYTAYIMQRLDKKSMQKNYCIDYYNNPKSKEEEIRRIYDSHAEYISREFNEKNKILADTQIRELTCYKCNRKASKYVKWFLSSANIYYAIAYCKKHGYILYKIRLKQAKNQKYYAIKTTHFINEEKAQTILKRQIELREKRKVKCQEKLV